MYLVPLSSLPTVQRLESSDMPKNSSANTTTQSSFASMMQEAMTSLEQSQRLSAEDAYNLAMGDVSSLHSMMINSAMETAAVETVVQITSRAVSAYKEIMQMQI